MTQWAQKHCKPCEGGVSPMGPDAAAEHLRSLGSNWALDHEGKWLIGKFLFKNYYETSAFVNAVVWIAHGEDHHPDIAFGYKNCTIRYSTHAIGGLSENDFICAAKVDQLVRREA